MGKEILKTTIKRESGKLYYCATDKKGCLVLCEAVMKRGGKKKSVKKKAVKKKVVKKTAKKPVKRR